MTTPSELSTLYNAVKARFHDEIPGVVFAFGRREPPKQINQGTGRANRIVFVPGDQNGDIGEEVAPRYIGSNPRPLKDELEKFQVYAWGYDSSAHDDEVKQHDAAWTLFCAWRRAMFLIAEGRTTILGKQWVAYDRVLLPFGMEIRATCTIRSQVRDDVLGRGGLVKAFGAHVDLTATELDVTKHARK